MYFENFLRYVLLYFLLLLIMPYNIYRLFKMYKNAKYIDRLAERKALKNLNMGQGVILNYKNKLTFRKFVFAYVRGSKW